MYLKAASVQVIQLHRSIARETDLQNKSLFKAWMSKIQKKSESVLLMSSTIG